MREARGVAVSGGSFDYLCHAFVEDLLRGDRDDQLDRMQAALADVPWGAEAAAATAELIAEIDVARARVAARFDRLKDVWKGVEWWRSGDWGEDQAREEAEKFAPLPHDGDQLDAALGAFLRDLAALEAKVAATRERAVTAIAAARTP